MTRPSSCARTPAATAAAAAPNRHVPVSGTPTPCEAF
jgi:hypothetical protein